MRVKTKLLRFQLFRPDNKYNIIKNKMMMRKMNKNPMFRKKMKMMKKLKISKTKKKI